MNRWERRLLFQLLLLIILKLDLSQLETIQGKPMLQGIIRFISSAFSFTDNDKQLARERRYSNNVLALEMLHL